MKKYGTLETFPWDTAEDLNDEEDVLIYLNLVLEENDPELLQVALGNIARSKGMTAIARKTGMTKQTLYKALSKKGNPGFKTISKVLDALGLRVSVSLKEKPA